MVYSIKFLKRFWYKYNIIKLYQIPTLNSIPILQVYQTVLNHEMFHLFDHSFPSVVKFLFYKFTSKSDIFTYHASFHFGKPCFHITNTRWRTKDKLSNAHTDTICRPWGQHAMLVNTVVVPRVDWSSHVDWLRHCMLRGNARYRRHRRQQGVWIPRLIMEYPITIALPIPFWPEIFGSLWDLQ